MTWPVIAVVGACALVAVWLYLYWRRRRVLRLQWPRRLGMRTMHRYTEIYLRSQGFDVMDSAWDRASYEREDRAFLLFFHTPKNAIRPLHLADFAREYLGWKQKYVVTEIPVDAMFVLAAAQAGIGIIRPAELARLADPDYVLPKLRP